MNKSTKAHATACSILSIILLVPAIGAWGSWNALPKHVETPAPEVVIPQVEQPHTVTLETTTVLDEVIITGVSSVHQHVTTKPQRVLEWTCIQRAEGIKRIDDHGNVVRIDPIKVCEWL